MSFYDDQEEEYFRALSSFVDLNGDPYRPSHLFDPVEHAKLVERGIWRSADGRETPITMMTDQHLVNSLRYIKHHAIESLEMELSSMRRNYRLGDTSHTSAERAFWAFIEKGANHIVGSTTSGSRLLNEWKRRGYHEDGWHINFRATIKKRDV